MPTQTPEQLAATIKATGMTPPPAGPGQTPAPIAVSTMTQPQVPVAVATPPVVPLPNVANIAVAPPPAAPAPSPASGSLSALDALSAQLSTRKTNTQVAVDTATAPYQQELNQLNAALKMQQAKAIKNQELAMKQGDTLGFATREAQNIARTDAIETLRLASLAEYAQGNIALAEKHATNAANAKYEQIEADIRTAKQNIYQNYDTFTAAEKKRADATLLALDANDGFVRAAKEDNANIIKTATIARQNGADNATVEAILNAKTPAEALSVAGNSLRDPKADLEIKLLKEQILTQQKQRSLLGEPTAAEKKATAAALKEAQASIPVMQDKITAVDVLQSHPGLDSRVGPNIFSRAAQGIGGFLGRFASGAAPGAAAGAAAGAPFAGIGAIPGAIGGAIIGGTTAALQGIGDTATGAGQDFAGGVHKLTGGLTLQNLIDAKARGATFGALSEGELKILADSATALNDWEIKDSNGKGTGYWNIDEASFKRELTTIQDLTRRALLQAQGTLLTEEEQATLDALDTLGFSPAY